MRRPWDRDDRICAVALGIAVLLFGLAVGLVLSFPPSGHGHPVVFVPIGGGLR